MREVLSEMIAQSAQNNPNFVLMTGDHGYALFDKIRTVKPESFINVGIMEQGLISLAAGMAKTGFKPMCYGLAAFIPLRVLEQIKFDVCLPNLPIKMIGDGAGLVYTILGSSHQCAEDITVLRSLPDIEIYSPGDPEEMRVCYREFSTSENPAYLRVGKADSSDLKQSELKSTLPYFTNKTSSKTCIISTGAMLGIANKIAKDKNVSHLSIMRIKPLHLELVKMVESFDKIIVIEEHTRNGGLTSAITDFLIDNEAKIPVIKHFTLNSSFTKNAGSYQYALSEHGISHQQLTDSISNIL